MAAAAAVVGKPMCLLQQELQCSSSAGKDRRLLRPKDRVFPESAAIFLPPSAAKFKACIYIAMTTV